MGLETRRSATGGSEGGQADGILDDIVVEEAAVEQIFIGIRHGAFPAQVLLRPRSLLRHRMGLLRVSSSISLSSSPYILLNLVNFVDSVSGLDLNLKALS